jgi:hypothetical protein
MKFPSTPCLLLQTLGGSRLIASSGIVKARLGTDFITGRSSLATFHSLAWAITTVYPRATNLVFGDFLPKLAEAFLMVGLMERFHGELLFQLYHFGFQ